MKYDPRKFVYSTPRHFRAIYFVESDIPGNVLSEIARANLRVWGGRYNPIIPVRNGKVDESYMNLLKVLDPDTVFYSYKVDKDEIRRLHLFNPLTYEKMDERGSPTVGGVNVHYLLDESVRDFMFEEKLPILNIQGSHNIDLKAKSFYQTNFGLLDLYAGEDKFIRGLDIIQITKANHVEINKIIAERSPYFKSILSQLKINACILRPKDFRLIDWFELIVSNTNIDNEDLFYYWNRQQFIEHNRRLYQLVISKEDLNTLIADPFFGHILEIFSIHNSIHLVSRSIDDDELAIIRDQMQDKFKGVRFEAIKRHTFPYDILDHRFHNQLSSERRKQIFGEEKDLLKLTPPKLSSRLSVSGSLIYDVEVEINVPGQSPESHLKLPVSYPLYRSRINRFHNQSIMAHSETTSVDFAIPDNFEIFQRRILNRRESDESLEETGIYMVRYSSAGQKLYALFELFGNNWSHLMQLIDDKFWLDALRSKSEVKEKKSNIPGSKGILSYQDLLKERRLLYGKYREKLHVKWKRDLAEIDVDKMIESQLDHDMKYDVDRDLQDLTDIGGVFMGMKVKCHTCGSNKWYSLAELRERLPCKGCGKEVIPQIESPYYYKVNEIIVNNLLSDPTSNSKEFDGNYVVLRALNFLKAQSRMGFISCCPLEFAIRQKNDVRWISDIDILAIQDGKFIIGEAKSSASEFSNPVIESLIRLAQTIKPDTIMVAYASGDLPLEKIERIKTAIGEIPCELIQYKVEPAFYFSGGLFGMH